MLSAERYLPAPSALPYVFDKATKSLFWKQKHKKPAGEIRICEDVCRFEVSAVARHTHVSSALARRDARSCNAALFLVAKCGIVRGGAEGHPPPGSPHGMHPGYPGFPPPGVRVNLWIMIFCCRRSPLILESPIVDWICVVSCARLHPDPVPHPSPPPLSWEFPCCHPEEELQHLHS